MATRTISITERKAALAGEVAQLEQQLRQAKQDVIDAENALAPFLSAISALEAKQASCASLQAAGAVQVAERAEIETDLYDARTTYKTKGAGVGLPAKVAKVQRLRAQLQPLEIELQEIYRAENVARDSNAIEEHYQAGLAELQQLAQINKSFQARIVALRQYKDPAVMNRAYKRAQDLQLMANGIRP